MWWKKNTELDQLLENAPLPFIVQHASRISSVKQRVSSLNLVLKSITRRIDNIDQMLSTNITQGNMYMNSKQNILVNGNIISLCFVMIVTQRKQPRKLHQDQKHESLLSI